MLAAHKVIVRNASIVARRYKSKCWWSSENDVSHDAIVAQLDCMRTADPTRPFIRYAWRTAVFAASASIKRASSPASCGGSDPDRLVGLKRSDMPTEIGGRPGTYKLEVSNSETAEELFFHKELVERIRHRIVALLGEDGLVFAIDMLTGEFRPADVSKAHGIPIASVYQSVQKIREVISSDPELYGLWKEEPDG